MSLLVVGSVALDSVETPFGKAEDVLGGSATYFSVSASHQTPVQLVGVVGNDYPVHQLEPLRALGIDLAGLEHADGESFRWRGRYRHDLNSAETLETQLQVLEQVDKPKFVACDTMNFWIESRRGDLMELLERVDLITLNDGEARQLTDQANLVQAARWILDRGPRTVLIKKGEHGAFMFTRDSVFYAPAYPLEAVFDPTGAGDSFAGGFMGYLARTNDLSDANLRRAVIVGSAMGSFVVEAFSIGRLLDVTRDDIDRRVADFHRLVSFDQEMPA